MQRQRQADDDRAAVYGLSTSGLRPMQPGPAAVPGRPAMQDLPQRGTNRLAGWFGPARQGRTSLKLPMGATDPTGSVWPLVKGTPSVVWRCAVGESVCSTSPHTSKARNTSAGRHKDVCLNQRDEGLGIMAGCDDWAHACRQGHIPYCADGACSTQEMAPPNN